MAAAHTSASLNPQPAQPAQPAPPVAPAKGAAPSTSANLLSVVRILIAFGHTLAKALANHPGAQTLQAFTRTFGTRDLAVIMVRIMHGLRLAQALEQRLLRNARQIDNPRFRVATPRAPTRREPADQPAPRTAETNPQDDERDLLARLPTAEEIAEQIRHRPIGAVLADICRDLGISIAHPAWSQIFLAVAVHRGNVVRLLEDLAPRMGAPRLPGPAIHPFPAIPFVSPQPATGPP